MIKRNIYIVILFVICIVPTQRTNAQANDSEFLFSIDGLVNQKYYTQYYSLNRLEMKYRDMSYDAYREYGPDYFNNYKVAIPDSIADLAFLIKKGFHYFIFDSTSEAKGKISSFYSKTSEGIGTLTFFDTGLKPSKGRLLLVYKNEDAIEPINYTTSFNLNENLSLKYFTELSSYFDSNRKTFLNQISHQNREKMVSLVHVDYETIKARFSMKPCGSIGDSTFILEGIDKEYSWHKYIAIYNEDGVLVEFLPHALYLNSFFINGVPFLFVRSYAPSTGMNSFTIYKIKENKLIHIFSDASYST